MMKCTKRIALIAVIVLLVGVAGVAWSQSYGPAKATTGQAPGLDCREVLAELQTLGADMVEFDTRLYRAVETMQQADEDEQLAATQAVVEEMVAQRCLVIGRIKTSHQQLVHHFLKHLLVEPDDERRFALVSCPLMDYMQRSPSPPSASERERPLER
jgi:hypothetical protein